MTDITLNAYLARGTQAERLALTPNPGDGLGVYFYETDTKRLWAWDAAAWKNISGPTVNDDSGTTINLGTSDSQSYKRCTAATPVTVNLTSQATASWGANSTIAIEQTGNGQVTVVPAAGVTMNYQASLLPKTAEKFSVIQLVRVALNTWTLFGSMAPA